MTTNFVPKASPTALPELEAYLAPFAPLFQRHTSRDSMERYLTGLLTDLPHKTADTIAAAVAGTSTERLQHLLTDAAWDASALDAARVQQLLAAHPPTAGVLVLDDTGLPKKGTASVGVAAQYSGRLSQDRQLPGGGQRRVSGRRPGEQFPLPLAGECPVVLARVLDHRSRSPQDGPCACAGQPTHQAGDCLGLA